MTEQEIIEAVDAERKRQGITAYAMCKQAGVRHESYSHWKHGKNSPTLAPLMEICKVLGIRIEVLKS